MKMLIDGMHFLYKCDYAYPLSTSQGKKVGAIYGFLKGIKDLSNKFGVIPITVWEGRSFRKQISDSYKKGREIKDFIKIQQEDIQELFSYFNIVQVYHPRLEADDVLAYLAKIEYKDEQVIIVTSDKDLFQVIDDKNFVYDSIKKVMYNEQEVFNKLGIKPEKVKLYKILLGDSSDNIKGIPRIYKKNAIEIINKVSSLDEIYSNLEIVGKYKDKFLEFKEHLKINEELVTLKIDLNRSELLIVEQKSSLEKVKEKFEQLEFKSFLEKFDEWKRFYQKCQGYLFNKNSV